MRNWLPLIVTVGIALMSVAVNYGVTKAEMGNVKEQLVSTLAKNASQDDKIQAVQIDRAGDHQLLLNIMNTLEEIKRDVKEVKHR